MTKPHHPNRPHETTDSHSSGTLESDHTTRILCVDDHNLVLEGLLLIIERQRELRVVASATNGQEAIRLYRRHKPDITIMDLQLPVMGGLEAVRTIRAEDPKARIIILTTFHGDEDIYRAIEAGAAAYVMKDALSQQLIQVIHRVAAGEVVVTKEMQDILSARAARPTLSRREVQVLTLIAKGHRNKEMATILGLGNETLQGYIKSMFLKLEVNNRTAAVNVAVKRSIIHLDE